MLTVNWHMIAQQIHDFVLLPTLKVFPKLYFLTFDGWLDPCGLFPINRTRKYTKILKIYINIKNIKKGESA